MEQRSEYEEEMHEEYDVVLFLPILSLCSITLQISKGLERKETRTHIFVTWFVYCCSLYSYN